MSSILAFVIGGLNFPIFIWYKAIGNHCFVTKLWNYFVMLNTLFYVLVSTALMFLANASIIYKLMYIKY